VRVLLRAVASESAKPLNHNDQQNHGVFAVFKMMILLKKNSEFSDEEFSRYWLETHASLAKKMPGLRRYVVNVVKRPPGREPDYHGVLP
jgi:hypothetical protein